MKRRRKANCAKATRKIDCMLCVLLLLLLLLKTEEKEEQRRKTVETKQE